jgi:hypothetical protein
MRVPRVRFTVRRMMVAVAMLAALLAIGAGLQRRQARFERLFSYHRGLAGPMIIHSFDPGSPTSKTASGRWHWDLSMKYADAARRPWLPVAPDPPEPK